MTCSEPGCENGLIAVAGECVACANLGCYVEWGRTVECEACDGKGHSTWSRCYTCSQGSAQLRPEVAARTVKRSPP